MTPREKDLYGFVRRFCAANGYSPSYGEIGEALGLPNKSGIHRMVASLVAQGYLIEIVPGRKKARNILPARPELAWFTRDELENEIDRRRAAA